MTQPARPDQPTTAYRSRDSGDAARKAYIANLDREVGRPSAGHPFKDRWIENVMTMNVLRATL